MEYLSFIGKLLLAPVVYFSLLVLSLFFSVPFAHAAVAFDTSGTGAASTWTYTTSGANRALIVERQGDVTDTATGATYAGTAMVLLTKYLVTANRWTYIYYLVNPAAGANSVVLSGGSQFLSIAVSYTGVDQTITTPVFANNNNSGQTSITSSITTPSPNDWVALLEAIPGGAMSAGTNATSRVADTSEPAAWYDTNGPQAQGSVSMTVNNTGNNNIFTTMVAVEPVPVPVTTTSSILGLIRAFWIW